MEQQIEYLQRLGLEIDTAAGIAPSTGVRMPHTTVFRVPSFRVDLKREIDLIEEVARLYGVDKIPATAPRGAIGSNPYDAVHDQLADARRILTGLGLFEAQGQTLISDAAAKLMAGESLVPLSNPLSSDMNVLRPESAARACWMRCATTSATRPTTWPCSRSAASSPRSTASAARNAASPSP